MRVVMGEGSYCWRYGLVRCVAGDLSGKDGVDGAREGGAGVVVRFLSGG